MSNQEQKDKIILSALKLAPVNGWSKSTLADAARAEGMDPLMVEALFPCGAKDAAAQVSDYFDRLLMGQLKSVDAQSMRTRDRIAHAVMTRLDLMAPYRDGLKPAMAARLRLKGARALWRSANVIWTWAGDTATDYNRYTKRGLLAGVMLSTTLYWFQDNSPGFRGTHAFLERRIGNIMDAGRVIGMIKTFASRKRAA